MAKAYTTSTASIKVPVILSFSCPKCGQFGSVNKTALLSAQATVRGYNSAAAGQFAQQNLAATADNQVKFIIENLEKGNLNTLLDEQGRNINGKVVCPHCGVRQIVDVGGKRKTLHSAAFVGIIVALIFAMILFPILGMSLSAASNGQNQGIAGPILVAEALCVAAFIAIIVYNKKQSRKAYDDPALMEKRYHCVLNPHLEAGLMLGLGNLRHVDIRGTQGKEG